MDDRKQISFPARTDQNKSFFIIGMIGIGNQYTFFIQKYGSGFFKGNAMFLLIGSVLIGIPFKAQIYFIIYTNIIIIS